MSATLNTRADTSGQSCLTLQDLSIGSLASISTTPLNKLRIPSATSTTSGTTAPSSALINTPSPSNSSFSRRRTEDAGVTPMARRIAFKVDDIMAMDDEESAVLGDGVMDTPGRLDMTATGTPMPNRIGSKRKGVPGAKGSSNLTLRDQEKHIDALKKENFNIKLKVHFLEERLAQLAPDQIDSALKQNINLKIEVQQRGLEMKKYKKLVLELERELERLQRGGRYNERELEEKIDQLEAELRDARRKRGSTAGMGGNDAALRERNVGLEERVMGLEEELENARRVIEENVMEMDRLAAEKKSIYADDDLTLQAKLEARIGELEADNEDLRLQLDDHAEALSHREDEREELMDEIQSLKLQIEDITLRREAEMLERSESRAQIIEEREEREAIEDDLNAYRDKLAAAAIEISQKDDEIELKSREINDLISEHGRIVAEIHEEWRGEVEEHKSQCEKLRDVLAERCAEVEEQRLTIKEMEAHTADTNAKFEMALAHLEREAEEKDIELQSANGDVGKLGQRVYELEDEIEYLKAEADRIREDEESERERLEALSRGLREKYAQYKAELEGVTELYEQATQDVHVHRERREELAKHIEDLVSELRRERELREKCELELDSRANRYDASLRRERRELDAKDSALQSALSDLARAQALLMQREHDVTDLQSALNSLEAESRKLGESATTDRFSLQLEVDRLKRDIERLEEELARARSELSAKEAKFLEKDDKFERLYAENRELTNQLSAQTQARLNVTEKLDTTQTTLRSAESELATCKQRLKELESRLSKDQRSSLQNETQLRDQLTERNTLLLTIYSYMDKILGIDKTAKKAETKPFTNFGVFHDLLMSRLKSLNQISTDFEKRSKELEVRHAEKVNELKKQLDQRWRQIDKFESSLKNIADSKQTWKRKITVKESELDALKSTNAELTSQVASLKKPAQSESMEIKALQTRLSNAERRLANSQNQLATNEEKMASMNQKAGAADSKWEARVKEWEARLRGAEERVKRERQGAKERVLESETNNKTLRQRIDFANKRIAQLESDLKEKTSSSSSVPTSKSC